MRQSEQGASSGEAKISKEGSRSSRMWTPHYGKLEVSSRCGFVRPEGREESKGPWPGVEARSWRMGLAGLHWPPACSPSGGTSHLLSTQEIAWSFQKCKSGRGLPPA